MKMTKEHYQYLKKEHYQYLKKEISAKISDTPKEDFYKYLINIKEDSRVKNPQMRVAWDLTYAAGLNRFICDELYHYLTDTHINTAVIKILKELEVKI